MDCEGIALVRAQGHVAAHHPARLQLLQSILHRDGADDAIAKSRIHRGNSGQGGPELTIVIEIDFWIEVNSRYMTEPLPGQFMISLGKLDVDMDYSIHKHAVRTGDGHNGFHLLARFDPRSARDLMARRDNSASVNVGEMAHQNVFLDGRTVDN